MDLVYMPEIMTYGSFRAPALRDYEQPWNKNYFQYGMFIIIFFYYLFRYSVVFPYHQLFIKVEDHLVTVENNKYRVPVDIFRPDIFNSITRVFNSLIIINRDIKSRILNSAFIFME